MKKIKYYPSYKILSTTTYEYDAQGKKLKKTVYDARNTVKEYAVYHY